MTPEDREKAIRLLDEVKEECRVWREQFERQGEKLEAALLRIRELEERIYKLGLWCDSVPGLEHGFCPDVGEPRDNLTRIRLAFKAHEDMKRFNGELQERYDIYAKHLKSCVVFIAPEIPCDCGFLKPKCGLTRPLSKETCALASGHRGPCDFSIKRKCLCGPEGQCDYHAVTRVDVPINQQCWCAAKAETKDAVCPIHG